MLPAIARAVEALPAVATAERNERHVSGTIRAVAGRFAEEQRSKQPSIFSLLRALIELFTSPEDTNLGACTAPLAMIWAFQFEPLRLRLARPDDQRDLVLYLPDELIVIDHRRDQALRYGYDFETDGRSTYNLPRVGTGQPYRGSDSAAQACDHQPGEYAEGVRVARRAFQRGDLFEVVPGQTFFEACPSPPSELFRRLRERNPSPYGFLINLGQAEYLVGASPEMYVRVEGDRVETCPISGTIARGRDPISDAEQILRLLKLAQGRVRADHVYGCGPQRQVPDL